MPTTKKNPPDSTLRNLRAAKRRDGVLAKRLDRLATLVSKVSITAGHHEARLRALERKAAR